MSLYGLVEVGLRLPRGLPAQTLAASSAWTLGLLAAAGMVLAAGTASAAVLTALAVSPRHRPGAAAAVEMILLAPVLLWLILNEVTYSTTSEIVGYETLLMIWANPGAVFQNAWQMGTIYLLASLIAVLMAVLGGWWISRRSFQSLWPYVIPATREDAVASESANSKDTWPQLPHSQTATLRSRPCSEPSQSLACSARSGLRIGLDLTAGKMVCSMIGGLSLLATLLVWQAYSQPSKALTIACRSAPPLRALNLTRALIGTGLDSPVDLRPGVALMTDVEYQASMGTPTTPAPNVILIVLESVSAKALHCYGHPRTDVSPNMDALAANGVLFEHCLATGSFSSYGLVSIMTSLHMLRAKNNDHFADTSFPHLSLPQALKLAGYQLALFSSGNEAFDNINHFCPQNDFDVYFSLDTADVPKSDCMRLDDHYAVEQFESWLSQRKDSRPFYCGFYLQSTHFNYEVPEPWASYYQPVPPLFSNGNGIIHIPPDVLPLLKNQYDNSMRFSDYWVGRIRAALERAGAFDNSIVVIVADHGEAFMEHGLARHGVALWDEMIHIPFILYAGPTVRARLSSPLPSRVAGTVSGLDVAPTVAGLVGIRPHPSWQGENTLAAGYTSQDRPIFSVLQLTRWQEAVVLNGFKYVYDLTDLQDRLFCLDSDPGETTDLITQRPELATVLRSVLATWHNRQLHYYSPANRPFQNYLGPLPANGEKGGKKSM